MVGRWLFASLSAVFLSTLAGCGGGTEAPKAPREAWTPLLEQLIPADVDVVARVDWARAREAKVGSFVKKGLRDSGLSEAILDAVEGCLDEAKSLRLGLRLGEHGLDGDVILVVAGLPRQPMPTRVPCGAKGWKHAGHRRNLDVFEPEVPSSDRSAAALMMRSDDGDVVVATPGQIDALLRVLRDGPDGERLDPKGDAVLVVEARVNDAMLPAAWKAQAPELSAVAFGLVQGTLRVQVDDAISIRAALTYVDASAAENAGKMLKVARDALDRSEQPLFRSVAKSAHASVQGELLRVEFAVPRHLEEREATQKEPNPAE